MNIVCEKCATVYRIDPSRIPKHGKRVKCSKCGHIFVARAPTDEDDVPTAEHEPDFAAELSEDVHDLEAEPTDPGLGKQAAAPRKRLLLRQDGTRYAVSDLATLQRWIVERRVSRDAELSEDGEVWERVGERMDLLPFFGIVERTRKKSAARKARKVSPETGTGVPDASSRGIKVDEPTVVQRRPEAVAAAVAAEALAGAEQTPTALSGVAEEAEPLGDHETTPEKVHAPAPDQGKATSMRQEPSSPRPEQENAAGSPPYWIISVLIVVLVIVAVFLIKGGYIGQRGTATNDVATRATPTAIKHPVASARTPVPKVSLPARTPSTRPEAPVRTPSVQEKPAAVSPAPTTGTSGQETGTEASPRPTSSGATTPKPVKPSPAVKATPKPAPAPTKQKTAPSKSPTKVASSKSTTSSTHAATSSSASRWISIGQSRLRARRFDDAVEAFRNAVAKSPNSARTHKELGLGLLNLADVRYGQRKALLEEAAREFQTSIQLNSNYAEAYHLLGVTYMQLDRKAEAAKNLRLALAHGLSGDDATEAKVFLQNLVDELAGEGGTP